MVVFENIKFKNINSVGNYFVEIPLNKYKNTVFVGANGTGKCFFINTIVRLKNKKTNEIKEITIGELYDKAKQNGT
jgi:ABC-type transport system involved in cytochrome bd biosynthesis fused ATPase/permease subunit